MEDFEVSNDSSSNSPENSSARSSKTSNTSTATNMAKYLNLTDPSNPFRLDSGDNPAVVLVTDLLTSDNYPTWSRAMRRALRAKNKLGFVTGSISQPTNLEDPLLDLWERCNDMVVSWLHNSISLSIKTSVAFVDDAHELWLDLQNRFSHQNGPRIYQLKKALASLLQESDTVSIYYGKLKTLWDELLIYDPIPDCSCGSMKTLSERYQRDYVFQFLMGLNDTYSPVRDQIMLLDPLPPITKVFSLIQQQERHYQMTPTSTPSDSMAFSIRKPYPPSNRYSSQPRPKKERAYCSHCKITGHSFETCFKVGNAEPPICAHCNMSGHTMEKCYKVHGYPPGHKLFTKSQGSNAFAAQAAPTASNLKDLSDGRVGLTLAQYQQLMALLQPLQPPTTAQSSANQIPSNIPTNSTSHISGISTCLSTCTQHSLFSPDIPWIIDTGATDHMVCCTSFFTTTITHVSHSVRLPTGTTVPVTHTGTVHLTPSLHLTGVLCVPSFNFNLISAKKLAANLTCCLVFFSDFCLIQDLLSWTTIGKGEVKNGLYHLLNINVSPSTLVTTLSHFSTFKNSATASALHTENVTDLWHCRLGHLSFPVLNLITDPIVKQNISISNTKPCYICPLAKFHRLSFPHSNHKTLTPFELVHCDLWGPCSVPAYDGSKYFLTIVDDFTRSTWLYLLPNKAATRTHIESFANMIENQFNLTIKILRSDNGKEFQMKEFFHNK